MVDDKPNPSEPTEFIIRGIETKAEHQISPNDTKPACPRCHSLTEVGIAKWVKGYPQYYCYNCSTTFWLKVPRGVCRITPGRSVSPTICTNCLTKKIHNKQCVYFQGFLPFPREMAAIMKEQKAALKHQAA